MLVFLSPYFGGDSFSFFFKYAAFLQADPSFFLFKFQNLSKNFLTKKCFNRRGFSPFVNSTFSRDRGDFGKDMHNSSPYFLSQE